MAIKRPRLHRTPSPTIIDGKIYDLAPDWLLKIVTKNHGTLEFDFNPMRINNREAIATDMRDAIWSLRFESEGASLQSYFSATRRFWKFLDDTSLHVNITRLDQVDRECINRYLTWMELQIIPSTHANAGMKIGATANRNSYTGLKKLLINRSVHSPAKVSNALEFPSNPFPRSNSMREKREPYSNSEHKRILQALHSDLKRIHQQHPTDLPSLQVLIAYLLILAATTGTNLQPLLELERDSLQSHPLEDRELLFTTKRRGWTSFAISSRKSAGTPAAQKNIHTIPSSIGDHFRALCAFTNCLIKDVDVQTSQFAFLWKVSRGKRKGEVVRLDRTQAKTGIRDFTRRHNLIDDNGKLLALSFSRIRPTFATDLYRTTRDLRRVSQALGHSSVDTTARYYVRLSPDAVRDQSITVESMVAEFTRLDNTTKLIIAADGGIPSNEIKFLEKNGYSTGIAHCRNPFRDPDDVCKKFLTCFNCPNMLVFEDDLWRLFSFYYRILSERVKMRADHWLKTYGPIIKKIDQNIAPLFPEALVTEARQKARQDPHPAWKKP